MRHAVILVLAIFSTGGACRYGMTAERFPPTSSPRGVDVRVETADLVLEGEVLEVQDTGLLVFTPATSSPAVPKACRVQLVRYGAIRAARFEALGDDYDISGVTPLLQFRERLRLVSRFPHGLAPDLLQQLLATCGQTELVTVEP